MRKSVCEGGGIRRIMGVLAAAGLSSGAWAAQPVLSIYASADCVKPELVAQFEKDNQCKVVIDTYYSAKTVYAKLSTEGEGYDLAFSGSDMVKTLFERGVLQPIQHAQVPNLRHIDTEYLKIAIDKEMHYSVPYMLTSTGIAFLSNRVARAEATWAMFDRTDLKGRTALLNDMRETIGAALKSLGYSLNTRSDRELAEAKAVVIRWKKNLTKFENEPHRAGLVSGKLLLAHGHSRDILQAQEENRNIDFVLPKEGYSISCEDMVIPKDAKEVELAHKFIDFMHEPKVAAENTEAIYRLCPNTGSYALLSEEVRSDPGFFPPPDIRAKGEVILDLGADNAKYTKIWDAIKAAP